MRVIGSSKIDIIIQTVLDPPHPLNDRSPSKLCDIQIDMCNTIDTKAPSVAVDDTQF